MIKSIKKQLSRFSRSSKLKAAAWRPYLIA